NSVFYELTYEGYAPGGVAIIIDTLTDNKNRTASEVRSTLTKGGGTLGTTGSVSYMFQTKGMIIYDDQKYTEEEIFEAALDHGADDVLHEDGMIEVYTAPGDFANVLESLQASGFEEESAEIAKIADQTVELDDERTRKVLKILERLEELDDVQQVFSNLEIPDGFEDEE
ncbi:MAG TPA: YebC/PmpR family DNA-binding transcriptional regulator, partial [Sphaerochaeta sp.]|nr:YebC/PmpR family DNA-binding transcriptional regulator [Sphaerochaeta sp.]